MEKDLIVHESPKSPVSESFRMLRTNISYLCDKKPNKVMLITSTMPGEGKSWVASNLGIAFSQTGQKTIVIDADLRKGRLHHVFHRFNKLGLSDYLKEIDYGISENGNDESLNEEIQNEILMKSITTTGIPNLYLMTSGAVPPNPSELLSSDNADKLIHILKQNFDVIIFDMPPVSIVADSLVLCKKVDYVVMVTAVGETKKDMLQNSKKAIENVGGKIAGIVLNKMPGDKRKEYNKYYAKYEPDEEIYRLANGEMKEPYNDLELDLPNSRGSRRRGQAK